MSVTKNTLKSARVLTAGTANVDQFSDPTGISFLDNIAYQVNVTGSDTPDLTLTFQVSLDYYKNPLTNVVERAGNWLTLQDPPGTDVSIAIGATGTYGADLNQLGFPWVRAVLTTGFDGNGVQEIIPVADVGGNLNNTYFSLFTPAGNSFYIWFNVDGAGVDPNPVGYTGGVEVDISANDDAATIAGAADTAIQASALASEMTSAINIKSQMWTITNVDTGTFPTGTASTAIGFTFDVLTPDTRSDIFVGGKSL